MIDLRGETYERRLLALSLQGILNKKGPRIYVLWESKDRFGNPSEEWLEYYKSKGWVTYDEISLEEALLKYKGDVKDFVIYDPEMRHTINVAITMAGLYDTLVAHPSLRQMLEGIGYTMKEDLRGRWKDKYQAYEWQLRTCFPGAVRS